MTSDDAPRPAEEPGQPGPGDPSRPPEQQPPGQSESKPLPGGLAFVGMGLTIAGCVAAGVVLGLLVDAALHTSPAFLVVGLFVGVVAAAGAVTAQVKTYL